MSKMSAFSWPQAANAKLFERSEPKPPLDHHSVIVIGAAIAVLCIFAAYPLSLLGLKWRRTRAAKRRQDTEGKSKTIELVDREHSCRGPSPYVGDGHQGGDVGDSLGARSSIELPPYYSRAVKEDGTHDFVEIDLSSGNIRK